MPKTCRPKRALPPSIADQHPCCGRPRKVGDWPFPCNGTGDHSISRRNSPNIPPADRMVYFENAAGEVRVPGRADRPMHPKYAAAGFVRKECETIQDIRRVEQRTGNISEVLNYDRNSARADRDTDSV